MTDRTDGPPGAATRWEPALEPKPAAETGAARAPRRAGRPTEAELAQRTEALLEAAAQVFVETGFDNASYELIARRANVSTKTIYAWYGGKAGLFGAVVERYASRIEPRLRLILKRHCEDPERALAKAARIILAFEFEPELIALHRAVIAASGDLPDIGETFYRLGPGRGVQLLAEFFRDCHARQLLRVEDPVASGEIFMALLNRGVLNRRLVRAEIGPLTPRETKRQADTALAVFLAAHRAPRADRSITPG